jgi:hypothetical protein
VLVASIIRAMMKAGSTSETSVNFYQITRLNNPEDSHLHRSVTTAKSCFECAMGTGKRPLWSVVLITPQFNPVNGSVCSLQWLGYGLNNQISIPGRGKQYSLHHRVQTGPVAHPDSYSRGIGGLLPSGRAARAWSYHSPATSAEINNAWNYTSTPHTPSCPGV